MRWEVQMAAALLTRFSAPRAGALRTRGQVRNWSARLQGEHRSNRFISSALRAPTHTEVAQDGDQSGAGGEGSRGTGTVEQDKKSPHVRRKPASRLDKS
jgi:hypothetical protein